MRPARGEPAGQGRPRLHVLLVGAEGCVELLRAVQHTDLARVTPWPAAALEAEPAVPRGVHLVVAVAGRVEGAALHRLKRAARRRRVPVLVAPAAWSCLEARLRYHAGTG